MKLLRNTLLLLIVSLISCNKECKEIISRHNNGQIEVVYTFPNCDDSTYYKREYYYDNGQIKSSVFVNNGKKEGHCMTWSKRGVKTADWHMKDGITHGNLSCWYNNGVKSKETYIDNGKENGIEKGWYKNGKLAYIGHYKNGIPNGKWNVHDEKDESWYIRTYRNDTLDGYTYEYNIDSNGIVKIVEGYYKSGKEVGVWKWFDQDSTLTQTSTYDLGELNGEHILYYDNGSIKAIGNLLSGEYNGEFQYFDQLGVITQTKNYDRGKLINTIDYSNQSTVTSINQ